MRIVIIGAGIGGLACAIDAARAGFDVTVVERAPTVGGKMRQITPGSRPVDGGPTVLTMRWVFDELFADAGASLESHLPLRRVERIARHAWSDGARLDLFTDVDRSAAAIEAFAGAAEADRYRRFSAYTRRIYETVEGPFIRGGRPTPTTLLKARGLGVFGALKDIDSMRSMWRALGSHFTDPRLRQLFGRYATYCGGSPFEAPATLNLIAHVERIGVWRAEGGMFGVAQGLERLARALGVAFRFGEAVEDIEIEAGRARGVRLQGGERVRADAVVCNAGAAALTSGRLGDAGRHALPRSETPSAERRSLSAVTWAVEAETAGFPLDFHNVFFSDDYPSEFEDLFGRRRLPRTPTVYVCAQDRPGDIEGPERLLCLVNAPAVGDRDGALSPEELDACEARTFEWMERCGLTVGRTAGGTIRTDPAGFEALCPGTGGALYGAAPHGWRSSLTRPSARTRVPGLYLCGGEVHPGAGVPMAALSGRRAREAIEADRPSIAPSTVAVTPGGTSTSSTTRAASA